MSVKLAPCPFCGEEPRIAGEYDRWSVVCANYSCSRGRDTASLQRDAAKLWNQHWANGLISNTLELNQTLTSECLRLQRENEKYRRKLAKLVYLHKHPMPPTKWWNRSTGFLNLFGDDDISLRADAFVSALVYRRNAEGNGLRRYLQWQDCFCPIVDATKGKP